MCLSGLEEGGRLPRLTFPVRNPEGSHPVLLCITEFYRVHGVFLGFTRFYKVLQGFTGFYWVLQGFTYWVFVVVWAFQGCTSVNRISPALLDGIRKILSCTGINRI